jgi:hypothetical protein
MPEIDRGRIMKMFDDGDNADSNAAKDRALEELIVYLFGLVPGITLVARNEMNAFDAEEVDVALWNEGDVGGLRQFDHLILVECKNWSTAVGYPELAVFHEKLRSRGRPLGILVATNGITGVPHQLTRAHSVLAQALAKRREILVITRYEIERLVHTDQLVRLLKLKRAQLAVSGTIFLQN